MATYNDTNGNDGILGTSADDTITVSQGGTDTVDGGDGNDTLILDARVRPGGILMSAPVASGTGAGLSGTANWSDESLSYRNIENFTVYAGNYANTIRTGAGNDTASVQGGTYYGDTANSNIALGSGTDHLIVDFSLAGSGPTSGGINMTAPTADTIAGSTGYSGFIGIDGQGNGITYSGVDSLTITTGSGDDTVYGISNSDVISTGLGNDTIISAPGAGPDHIDAGAGRDNVSADWSDLTQNVVLDLSTAASVTAGVTLSDRYLHGVEQLTNFKTGAGNDTITLAKFYTATNGAVSVLSNNVDTGAGNDTVSVQGGTYYGDTGNDTVALGSGTDHLIVDFSLAGSGPTSGGINMTAPTADTIAGSTGYSGFIGIDGQGNGITYSGVDSLTITTGSGDDTVYGISNSDVISTGLGNDTIISAPGAGPDHIDAGAGRDNVSADWSDLTQNVVLDLSTAASVTAGVTLSDRYLHGVEQLTNFKTGAGNDTITLAKFYTATNGAVSVLSNNVDTGAGNDTVSVQGGTYYGDTGNDTVALGSGTDHLIVDFSLAGSGPTSGGINMTAPTADTIAGSTGYSGFIGIDGQGNGITYSGVDSLTITTGSGDDTVYGISNSDVISTGLGNDTIISAPGAGPDHIDAGAGRDNVSADWSDLTQNVVLDLSTAASVTAGVTLSDRYLHGVEQLTNFKTGAGNDTITLAKFYTATNGAVSVLSNNVDTGAGNDTVSVQGGTYYGDTGNDTVALGSGTDHLIVDFSLAGSGPTSGGINMTAPTADTIAGSTGYSGFIGIDGQGNGITYSGVDSLTITTGSGNDSLIGTGGGDVFNAGTGTNSVDGGAGNDTESYATAALGVTVSLAVTGQQSTGVSSDTLTNIENLTGSSHDDTLTGDSGDNILDGGAGADHMAGGLGNDIYYVDNAGDVVTENANEGTDEVRTTLASYTLGSNLENLTGLAATGQTLTGNGLDNTITGGSGNDTIDGGAGADHMAGGAGNDIYYVDNAGDMVTENANEGTDEVRTTLAAYALTANVENLTGTATTGQALTGNGLDNTITGGSGNDTIDGGAGADHMAGGAGNDVYYVDNAGDVVTENANEGTDEVRTTLASYTLGSNLENLTGLAATGQALTGNGLDNTITGGSGNDTIDGGAGADHMAGGAGNDVYYVDNAGDVVTENANEGTDEVRTTLASYTLGSNLENLTGLAATGQALTGNGLDNTITGGSGNDTIDGGAGADHMAGGAGNDIYYVDNAGDVVTENANEGTDEVRTTLASYTLGSNLENLTGLAATGQTLTGNGLDNTITGGSGNDTIDGGAGADHMAGGAGNDVYYVDNAGDVVTENANEGTDEVRTTLAAYALTANVENLTGTATTGQALTGNGLDNTITGGSGNDTIDGGAGADHMAGGAGNDVYYVDNAGDVVTENANEGTDEVRTTLASYTLGSNLENLTGLAATGQALTGNGLDNTITGGSGNDTIDGGAGADHMAGGAGNDVYYVDNAGDVVTENANEGTDEVRTTLASYTLGSNLENLTGLAATGQALTGNGLDNTITGGSGNDTIDGGAGADHMAGGAGNDIYYVDNAGDVVTENANEGTDEVRTTLASYTLGSNLENLTGLAATGQTLTGNGLDNTITGGSGNDTIDGGAGADHMAGGAGNDVYYVDNAGDVVTENANEGTDEVRTTLASYTLGSNLENLTGLAATGQTLTGNGLDNTITGGSGNDTIDGGAGADHMAGGAGNDIYYVDNAGDVVTENAGQGTDEVRTTLAAYALTANVENLTGTATTGQALTGNGLDNTITGGAGNDIIDGGAGADHMAGGAGNDIYYVDNAGDVVTETINGGTDEVRTSLSGYVLPDNVEILTYTGTGAANLSGNAGNNTVNGAGGNDYIDLSQGGQDTANAGGGNDAIYLGASFGSGDAIDGGSGTDTVGIRGDYTGTNKLTIAAGQLVNVETFSIMTSLTATPTAYDIAWGDGNLAANQKIAIYAGNLQAGENLKFDGSAETHGYFVMYGGLGTDDLKGGSGNDGFYFGPGKFTQADHVDGGGGAQNQLGLDGSYNFSASSGTLGTLGGNFANIQTLVLYKGDARDTVNPYPNVYHIETNDAAVASGTTLTVYGSLVASDLYFDGSAETDGRFNIYGGTGNDTLIGGQGDDLIYGGLGADTLKGGAGNDTFLYQDVLQSNGVNTDHILDFDAGDKIDLSGIDADTGTAGDQAFNFIGASAFTDHAGELRATFDAVHNYWIIEGDVNGDGIADLTIHVTTLNNHQIVATDFLP